MDTKIVTEYLMECNRLKLENSSLVTVLDHFLIPHKPHDSYSDTMGVVHLWNALRDLCIVL